MSDKDNIKLKTDTLSSRKSGSSVGVHVKRKRKIIAKPLQKQSESIKSTLVDKKESTNSQVLKNSNMKKNLNHRSKFLNRLYKTSKSQKNKKLIKMKK